MKNAIILHGSCDEEEYFSDKYPSLSNSHWFPWLQKRLLMNDILAQTPEMPFAYKASTQKDYLAWVELFERWFGDKCEYLIGHSFGGGFLLKWLTLSDRKIEKLFLIAPWLDPSRRDTSDFFDFEFDEKIKNRVEEVHLFISENDDIEGIQESANIIKSNLPFVKLHRFKDKGHFVYDHMKTNKFPELLEEILR